MPSRPSAPRRRRKTDFSGRFSQAWRVLPLGIALAISFGIARCDEEPGSLRPGKVYREVLPEKSYTPLVDPGVATMQRLKQVRLGMGKVQVLAIMGRPRNESELYRDLHRYGGKPWYNLYYTPTPDRESYCVITLDSMGRVLEFTPPPDTLAKYY